MQPNPSNQSNRVTTSYLLWLLGLLGLAGVHRLYNGKIGTGLLWLFTGGLLGIGQLVDLFLVPDMANEKHLQLMARYGMTAYGVPTAPSGVAAETVAAPNKEQMMVKLVMAAQQHGGQLSVTQAVLTTGLGFAEVEALLREMMKKGYASIDNDHTTGVVIYRFDELG